MTLGLRATPYGELWEGILGGSGDLQRFRRISSRVPVSHGCTVQKRKSQGGEYLAVFRPIRVVFRDYSIRNLDMLLFTCLRAVAFSYPNASDHVATANEDPEWKKCLLTTMPTI